MDVDGTLSLGLGSVLGGIRFCVKGKELGIMWAPQASKGPCCTFWVVSLDFGKGVHGGSRAMQALDSGYVASVAFLGVPLRGTNLDPMLFELASSLERLSEAVALRRTIAVPCKDGRLPAAPNYPPRFPKHYRTETRRFLIKLHWPAVL